MAEFKLSDAFPPGAWLYLLKSGTTDRLPSFMDAQLCIFHTHPIILDANGQPPPIFLEPETEVFDARVNDCFGNKTIWSMHVRPTQLDRIEKKLDELLRLK